MEEELGDDDDLTGQTLSIDNASDSTSDTPIWSDTLSTEDKCNDILSNPQTSDSLLMTGWRRDSKTNIWLPVDKENIFNQSLYKKGGYCFPLYYNTSNYEIPVSIGGAVFSLVISTTRRTLTVSSKDTLIYSMEAEEEDLVSCFPNKQCQLYSGPVIFINETDEGMVKIPRYDFYVSEGNFQSRLGLLGGTDKRCIFTHLRLRTDLFCINLKNISDNLLTFGERATPPAHCNKIRLVNWITGKKDLIALPISRIQCGEVKYRFDRQIPCIIHMETPRICLPQKLFNEIVDEINKKTGLFTVSTMEDIEKVQTAKKKFPTLRIWILCEDGSELRLSIHADNYTIQTQKKESQRISMAFAPVEKHTKLGPCIILGNTGLKGKRISISMSQKNAWIW